MDIYTKKSNWKIVLAIIGCFILLVTLVYSNYLASRLKDSELKNAFIYSKAVTYLLTNEDLGADVSLQDTIVKSFTIPIILEDEYGLLEGFNFGEKIDTSQIFLQSKKEEFLRLNQVPLEGYGTSRFVYYFDSPLLKYITFFPLIQVLLVGIFIALGYYLFSTARRAEQNRVWAGMAKETAHQLGTPISAILAWIEHLKESNKGDEYNLEIIDELSNDVNRLELIADRFSKIGSAPALEKTDISKELEKCINYMKRRASKKVSFDLKHLEKDISFAMINQHLFDWVIENIFRNALDATEGNGFINTKIYQEQGMICIEIHDSGKGIPSSKFKTVFSPGFSTKKRGWGLGLSLAKRIIENYHTGKIYVKSSKPGEGTVFLIKIPTA